MRKFIENARAAIGKILDVWSDRDIHIPALKQNIREIPAKFREAERDQQRNVMIVIGSIVLIQLLLITTI